jgi:predicted enzyme related to lactoylglutathione lyase
MTEPGPVVQMRLAVEADDYDEALAFYRDVLGLPEELAVSGPGGARVTILAAGRATLELVNAAQKRYIDEVEVGRPVAPRLRLAFEVADATAMTRQLMDAGARQIAPPTVTPWRSLNARLDGPAGLQLTLFQELPPGDAAASDAEEGPP